MRDNLGYLRSFADELTSQADRIRALIGNRHWLSDGTHKEHLIASQLQRHLPAGVILAKGFVADLRIADACSKEQDIMLVDTTTQAPLFQQGELAVVAPNSVIATVSVKSTMTVKTIQETIENQNSVKRIISAVAPNRQIFTAGYFFEVHKKILEKKERLYKAFEAGCRKFPIRRGIGDTLSANPVGPDLICASGGIALRSRSAIKSDNCCVRLNAYSCDGLAAAVLVIMLMSIFHSFALMPAPTLLRFSTLSQ